MNWLPTILLGITLLLMVLPFGRNKPQYSGIKHPLTLVGLMWDSLEHLRSNPWLASAVAGSILTHLLPALVVWQAMRVAPHAPEIGGLLVLEAVLCLAGGAVTFIMMALTFVSFGWGASSNGKLGLIAFALTGLNALGALAALVTAFAPSWLARVG